MSFFFKRNIHCESYTVLISVCICGVALSFLRSVVVFLRLNIAGILARQTSEEEKKIYDVNTSAEELVTIVVNSVFK